MPQNIEDIKQVITEVIQKQMVILGPDIAILKARNVTGLDLSEDGRVKEITGDKNEVLKELINEYVSLSGLIVRKTMEPLITKYPQLAFESGNMIPSKGG